MRAQARNTASGSGGVQQISLGSSTSSRPAHGRRYGAVVHSDTTVRSGHTRAKDQILGSNETVTKYGRLPACWGATAPGRAVGSPHIPTSSVNPEPSWASTTLSLPPSRADEHVAIGMATEAVQPHGARAHRPSSASKIPPVGAAPWS